jgi:N-formylglutamate amidohydrolase
MGYSVGVNRPYEGTLVPMAFRQRDRRVISIMIEVNRSLYMDEATGRKTAAFASVAQQMNRLLCSVSKFQELAVARAERA